MANMLGDGWPQGTMMVGLHNPYGQRGYRLNSSFVGWLHLVSQTLQLPWPWPSISKKFVDRPSGTFLWRRKRPGMPCVFFWKSHGGKKCGWKWGRISFRKKIWEMLINYLGNPFLIGKSWVVGFVGPNECRRWTFRWVFWRSYARTICIQPNTWHFCMHNTEWWLIVGTKFANFAWYRLISLKLCTGFFLKGPIRCI